MSAGPVSVDDTEIATADERDRKVPWRVFLGIGLILTVIAVVYLPSGEEAGTVMLGVAAILGLWCAIFLWRHGRGFEAGGGAEGAVGGSEDTAYLPTASPWPLGIGAGVALVFNGLVIGIWFLVPGVMILAVSIGGWARQSRHRR